MLLDPIAKPVLTLEEAADVLGIGRSTVYEAAHSGQIPARRINRLWLVPTAALQRFLEETSWLDEPEPVTTQRKPEPVTVRRD